MLKTMMIESIADKMIYSNRENNQGPAPNSKTIPIINAMTNRSGSQALRSEEDGIIVLLTVKTR